MANIQWYPGHMAKAIREIQEKLHLVDIIFELVDARIPESSRNPKVKEIIQQKPHLLILTKSDLADPSITKQWLDYYHAQGQYAIAVDSRARTIERDIQGPAQTILAQRLQNQTERGLKKQTIRAVCVGIPNVGKSTLLNHLVNKKIAKTADRPGVTKNQQWLKSKNGLALLDTPGILWPKFEDQLIGQKLAFTGAIKEKLFASDDVALFGLAFFIQHYPEVLKERYRLTKTDLELATPDLLLKITKFLGMGDDYDRASNRIMLDARKGKLGRFTLDRIEDFDHETNDHN
ncbi:ribosome biogenesis GTPase YlqF [Pediococcus cellicola]|uniref:Ribosome biogenesis GTPase A n=1 Tax=Pediococcus cellicola TaxID=319652 RepID=A0A0R2IZ32_9LACO|nr:ribosome biogenesis GTPase YlqF [Pediococcus cellicola]KRN67612.1 ylqF protein [Pediococcus cellicola]GEL14398.1 ribosome biogenesis GTPase A [Pediococcus cellicola]